MPFLLLKEDQEVAVKEVASLLAHSDRLHTEGKEVVNWIITGEVFFQKGEVVLTKDYDINSLGGNIVVASTHLDKVYEVI